MTRFEYLPTVSPSGRCFPCATILALLLVAAVLVPGGIADAQTVTSFTCNQNGSDSVQICWGIIGTNCSFPFNWPGATIYVDNVPISSTGSSSGCMTYSGLAPGFHNFKIRAEKCYPNSSPAYRYCSALVSCSPPMVSCSLPSFDTAQINITNQQSYPSVDITMTPPSGVPVVVYSGPPILDYLVTLQEPGVHEFSVVAGVLSGPPCPSVSCTVQAVFPEVCDNGIDDDLDNLIDCADPDCEGYFVFTGTNQALGNFLSMEVSLRDLDGDNDLDAFVANNPPFESNKVWINQGGDQFGTPGDFQDSGQDFGNSQSWGVSSGDLDGDGDIDLFVANYGEPNEVWINQGGDQLGTPGDFQDSGQALGAGYSDGISLGDVDGDGDLDALVANVAQPNKVWINQGGYQLGTPGVFQDSGQALGSSTDTSFCVALGDLDGDSDIDAYVGNYGQPDKVWINQGADQLGTPGVFQDSGQLLGSSTSYSVSLGDLDGDGDLDAFVSNLANQPNKVWINQGGNQLGTPGDFLDSGQALGSSTSAGVSLGDLDGDCDLDAFVTNENQPNRVWINQGGIQGGTPAEFLDSGQSLGSATGAGVSLGDLNGDGKLDAFVTNHGQPNVVWINETCYPLDPKNCWNPQQRLQQSTGQTEDQFGRQVAIDGDRMVVSSWADDDLGSNSGSVTVFERDELTGEWQETQLLLASNGAPSDYFGSAIDISGDYIFVGADGHDNPGSVYGAVYIFVRNPQTGLWAESQILYPASGNAGNRFGNTITVHGDLLAVGDPDGSTIFTGSVYLYQLDPQTGQWTQQQQLIPPIGPSNQGSFGESIAIGQGMILIGRPSDSVGIGSNVGSVYLYKQDPEDGNWVLEQQLLSSTAQANEEFGESVAIGEGVLVISAFVPWIGSSLPPGSTRILERDLLTGEWIETQMLTCSDGCGSPTSRTIALDGDLLAIGDVYSPASGSVTIYRRDLDSCQWIEVQQLLPFGGSSGDFFGTSVGISGRDIVVGAYNDDGLGSNAGAAYVFSATGLLNDCNGNGIEDDEDIASGFSTDCNGNGRPDDCDIHCVSSDCNSNGIPDECEEDCNGNGIPDGCDIAGGISQDVNDNQVPDECEEPTFIRGDANSDGVVDVGDVQFSLMTLFVGEAQVCSDGQDTNDDGVIDISDPIFTLLYLFAGGLPPHAPFPACGIDPTPDALDCVSFPPCP